VPGWGQANVRSSSGPDTSVSAQEARQLHVGVWTHGLSFYGWQQGADGGLVARHPHLDNGKGTLRLPLAEAGDISDDELRALLAGALTE
jgi:hypothetical protein